MQDQFRKTRLVLGLLMVASIGLFAKVLREAPNRVELGPRSAALKLEQVALDQDAAAPLRPARVWRVTSDDPRFGGISALALDGDRLIALTDSGVVLRFAKPGSGSPRVDVRELPDGPGKPGFKWARDSEALLRDPAGHGWWVAFENSNEIWLYDRRFRRPLQRVRLGTRRWPHNEGIEAMASQGRDLLLFPEEGSSLLRLREGRGRTFALRHSSAAISEAANVPGGDVVLIQRRLTPFGFVSNLVGLRPERQGFGLAGATRLDLGRLANVEAIAIERREDGGYRLWLMTDDNFQRPLQTLLVALEVDRLP